MVMGDSRFLQEIATNCNAKICLELGTGGGKESSDELWEAIKDKNGMVYTIDLVNSNDNAKDKNIEYIHGDDLEIGKTWNKYVDFIFIDTSHTYNHTLNELNLYSKWLINDGHICFHDIMDLGSNTGGETYKERFSGVMRAIDEFIEIHQEYSIILKRETGAGVLVLKKKSINTTDA